MENLISNCKIILYSIIYFFPLIIWFLFILAVILPSSRKMLRNFILWRNNVAWQAFIFALMFYLSSLLTTYCYGVFLQFTREPVIFEGLFPFMLLGIPFFSLGAFLLYFITSYIIRNKYWGFLLLGIIYGFACTFLLFYLDFLERF